MIRRHYPRLPVDIIVNCNGFWACIAKDISEGGLKIFTQRNFTKRTYIALEFILTPEIAIKTQGKVIHKNSLTDKYFEFGLQFWGLNEFYQRLIHDYIQNQKQVLAGEG